MAPSHSRLSMADWERHFPIIADWVKRVYHIIMGNLVKESVIYMPVKSGKRLVSECFVTYTSGQSAMNYFTSAFIRKSNKGQLVSLSNYMDGVSKLNTKKQAEQTIDKLTKIRTDHPTKKIFIHVDEFDYGSGTEQIFAKSGLYQKVMNDPDMHFIYYSATPEEAIIQEGHQRYVFRIPVHDDYRGAEHFLEHNLVFEAEEPFFKENDVVRMSAQVQGLIQELKNQMLQNQHMALPFLIVRTKKIDEVSQALLTNQFPELVYRRRDAVAVKTWIATSTGAANEEGKAIKWEDYQWWKIKAEQYRREQMVALILIDNFCSRSTDWFCHPFLFGYHDWHSKKTPLNTLIQMSGRIFYYANKKLSNGTVVYGSEVLRARLYTAKDVIEYIAGVHRLDQMNRTCSSRSVVVSTGPKDWAIPLRYIMTDNEAGLLAPLLDLPLNPQRREDIKTLLLTMNIPVSVRHVISHRQLMYKRQYAQPNIQGGIITVDRHFKDRHSSKPGGGDLNDDDNLHLFFYIDVATIDLLPNIVKNTIYFTYGLSQEEARTNRTHQHDLGYRNSDIHQPLSMFDKNFV